MKTNIDHWAAVAAAVPRDTSPIADEIPYGFSTKLIGIWRAARKDEKLRCWSLWSLRAALTSVAVCGMIAGLSVPREEARLLVSPLPPEFVAPPFSLQ